jgi:TRAP-type C4-dicarboxylate transport system permease small subunit
MGTPGRAPARARALNAPPAPGPLPAARRGARLRAVLERVLGVVAGAVLFVLMMLTVIDVIGRYVFNRPLLGAFEVTEMMLAALIYCGLPLVSQRREHIVIDTFDHFMARGFKRALDIAAEVVCSASLFGLSWLVLGRAGRVAGYGDTTDVLRLPLAPVAYLMAVMLLVAAFIHLWLIFVPHREDDGQSII